MIGSMTKMLEDMKAGVFDMTKDGACSNCGECCADLLPVSKREITTIKKYIKKHQIKPQMRVYPTAYPALDLKCPFRDDHEKKCKIYEVRPKICRDFKCDNLKKGIRADHSRYDKSTSIISMRETFYR